MKTSNLASWLDSDKLEKDTIYNSLLFASRYAKGNLLDVGCGKKPYYSIFVDKVDSYTGIDKKKADVIGSALDLPFSSNKFDTVLSTQVLEHVKDPQIMINELYRVLTKNGYAIVTAPLFWCLHEEPEDYFRFTKYSLFMLFKKAGFKKVLIRERGNWVITIGQLTSTFLESTMNRGLVKYPKKIIQILLQLICLHVSKINIIHKNRTAPLGYLILAQKV
jgi:SAM-dependent methyltransferase